jgi:hypothetical protein
MTSKVVCLCLGLGLGSNSEAPYFNALNTNTPVQMRPLLTSLFDANDTFIEYVGADLRGRTQRNPNPNSMCDPVLQKVTYMVCTGQGIIGSQATLTRLIGLAGTGLVGPVTQTIKTLPPDLVKYCSLVYGIQLGLDSTSGTVAATPTSALKCYRIDPSKDIKDGAITLGGKSATTLADEVIASQIAQSAAVSDAVSTGFQPGDAETYIAIAIAVLLGICLVLFALHYFYPGGLGALGGSVFAGIGGAGSAVAGVGSAIARGTVAAGSAVAGGAAAAGSAVAGGVAATGSAIRKEVSLLTEKKSPFTKGPSIPDEEEEQPVTFTNPMLAGKASSSTAPSSEPFFKRRNPFTKGPSIPDEEEEQPVTVTNPMPSSAGGGLASGGPSLASGGGPSLASGGPVLYTGHPPDPVIPYDQASKNADANLLRYLKAQRSKNTGSGLGLSSLTDGTTSLSVDHINNAISDLESREDAIEMPTNSLDVTRAREIFAKQTASAPTPVPTPAPPAPLSKSNESRVENAIKADKAKLTKIVEDISKENYTLENRLNMYKAVYEIITNKKNKLIASLPTSGVPSMIQGMIKNHEEALASLKEKIQQSEKKVAESKQAVPSPVPPTVPMPVPSQVNPTVSEVTQLKEDLAVQNSKQKLNNFINGITLSNKSDEEKLKEYKKALLVIESIKTKAGGFQSPSLKAKITQTYDEALTSLNNIIQKKEAKLARKAKK